MHIFEPVKKFFMSTLNEIISEALSRGKEWKMIWRRVTYI